MAEENLKKEVGVPEAYTPEELATMMRVSDDTIRRLAEDDKIPGAFRVGSQWRFNKDRVHEMMHA